MFDSTPKTWGISNETIGVVYETEVVINLEYDNAVAEIGLDAMCDMCARVRFSTRQ